MENIEKLQKVLLVQKQIKAIQDLTIEKVDSDCGRVSVIVNGNLQITEVKAVEGIEINELCGIFITVTNKAILKVNSKVKQSITSIMQDLGLPNMPF